MKRFPVRSKLCMAGMTSCQPFVCWVNLLIFQRDYARQAAYSQLFSLVRHFSVLHFQSPLLAERNFTSISARHEYADQKVENFHFLVCEPFDRFLQMLGVLCAQLPCTSVLNLTWFASQFTELLLRNRVSVIYPEFFRSYSATLLM